MRIRRARQGGRGQLRAQVSAARVDLVHQVEALHVRLGGIRETDRAGVVDEDVQTAELFYSSLDGIRDLRVIADVDRERQRLAACGLDLPRRAIDSAGKFRVGLLRLRGDGDIRAVPGGPQSDSEADTPTRSRYENCAPFES